MGVSCHGPLLLSPNKPSMDWEDFLLHCEAGYFCTKSEMPFDQYSL